jgi:hypothetical protein
VSDTPSADSGDKGSSFQAAKDAVASAAEQVRANAPGAYDASAKAARYAFGQAADRRRGAASQHRVSRLPAACCWRIAWLPGHVSLDIATLDSSNL